MNLYRISIFFPQLLRPHADGAFDSEFSDVSGDLSDHLWFLIDGTGFFLMYVCERLGIIYFYDFGSFDPIPPVSCTDSFLCYIDAFLHCCFDLNRVYDRIYDRHFLGSWLMSVA